MPPESDKVPSPIAGSTASASSPRSIPPRQPTLGRIVLYRITEHDKELMTNGQRAGDALPAVVVRVWPGSTGVNLKVFVDGPVDGWKTSVSEGATDGTWSWPTIV